MEKLTISEYAQKFNLTREAVFYQIKKGQLKAEQDKKTKKWTIFFEERAEPKQNDESENLKIELAELKAELRVKNEFIEKLETKNQEIIKSKNETIESQKKTIQALEVTYTKLEEKYQRQANLLEAKQEPRDNQKEKIIIDSSPQEEAKTEKEQVHQETPNQNPPKSPKTENTQIELMEFLKEKGITELKEKKKFRARFNRQIGKNQGITKDENGKIYLEINQDYSEILKP